MLVHSANAAEWNSIKGRSWKSWESLAASSGALSVSAQKAMSVAKLLANLRRSQRTSFDARQSQSSDPNIFVTRAHNCAV